MNVDSCLHAAADVLAPNFGLVEFGSRERLPGRGANMVVRTRMWDSAGQEHPVVIKAMDAAGPGAAREIAAARVLAAYAVRGAAPVLGMGADPPVIVFEDLGPRPTLATRLLGSDPRAAEAGLIAWAAALGRLQADTRQLRRAFQTELSAAAPGGGVRVDRMTDQTAEIARTLQRALPDALGVVVAGAAADELTRIAADLAIAGEEHAAGLSPADTCPDNAVETEAGYVLVDFEAADYRHWAWDAAYLTVPWPSCWCAWRLPDSTVAVALDAWRTAITPYLGPGASERLDEDLRSATIVWAFTQLAWLARAAAQNENVGRQRPQPQAVGPTARALVQHRLKQLTDLLDSRLPSLERLTDDVRHATTRRWGDCPLQLAPAFR